MAAGDRRTNHYLYPWHKFGWARSAQGTEQPTKVASPTVSAITATTATVTVGYTGFGAQHRLVYGRVSNRYECRTSVLLQPVAPGTVAFGLRELVPNSTYYVQAISTPVGPFPAGGDQSGVPCTSPEATFTTLVGASGGFPQSLDGQVQSLQDGPMGAPEPPSGDGGEPAQTLEPVP